MPNHTDIFCKVCKKNEFRFLFKNNDRMHHLAGEFDLYRCRACGLVIYRPLLTQEALASYYPKDYYSYQAAEISGSGPARGANYYLCHPLQAVNALFYSKILGQNRDLPFKPGQTVMDVGCGDGRYLLQENKKDCRIYGVDIDGDALKKIKALKPSAQVFCGNLWEAGFDADFFDAIHLSHVVEHIEEVDRLLGEVARIIRSEGIVKLQIPNTASFTRVVFGPFWIHWDTPRHIYGFSRSSFLQLTSASGLEIVSSRTMENSFSILGSLLYLFNAMTGKKIKLTKASRFWDSEILKIIFFPYCFLINFFGAGDTVEFILKKKNKVS